MKMNREKQREKILEKLDEHYGFSFIENYISIEEIIDANRSYKENVELLRIYLIEELLVGEFGPEIMRAIGIDHFHKLKEDLGYDEFERLMTEPEKKD